MILRLAASAASAALLVAGLGAVTPAQADTPGCVTRSEFKLVKHGSTKAKVHRVLDTTGKQTYYYSGYGRWESREYKSCVNPRWSYVNIDYKWSRAAGAWKVDGKSAYWG